MAGARWRRVSLPDAVLEVSTHGFGEPVVLIQTALTADEFLPLAARPELGNGYRLVLYHRRGYAGCSRVRGHGSIVRDATDCRDLMTVLGIERAHVVGVSYSAAVALQLAASAPARVHTLTLIEPPPVHIPAADEFLAANAALREEYRSRGPAAALDSFMSRVIGPAWRTDLERHLPGAVAQADQDADTFFATDLPALLDWRFTDDDARRVTQPVLYVGGSASGPWFAQVRELVLGWLPRARNVMVEGADHSLVVTHPAEVATALAAFLRDHPLGT